jgi:hypothetical protein
MPTDNHEFAEILGRIEAETEAATAAITSGGYSPYWKPRPSKAIRHEFIPPIPFGTVMISIDGERGFAVGEGATWCFNCQNVERHNTWEIDTTVADT